MPHRRYVTLLSVAEVAAQLSLTGSHLQRIIDCGEVPVISTRLGRVEIHPRDLSAFIDGCRLNPVTGIVTKRKLSASRRAPIVARDGRKCRYCGRRAVPGMLEVDHEIPVDRGGTNEPDNLVVACRPCNLRKGARTPQQAGMVLRPIPDA